MKITAFNPLIVSPKAADVIALMEALGFERAHTKTGINENIISVEASRRLPRGRGPGGSDAPGLDRDPNERARFRRGL